MGLLPDNLQLMTVKTAIAEADAVMDNASHTALHAAPLHTPAE